MAAPELEPLRQLVADRRTLGRLSTEKAASYLSMLNTPALAGPEGEVKALALVLLSRWALQLTQATLGSSLETTSRENVLLERAVARALEITAAKGVPFSPQLPPAVVLFLGAAATGCPPELRQRISEAVTDALQYHKPALHSSPGLSEVTAGIGHLMGALQGDAAAMQWLLVSVITLWTPAIAGSPQQQAEPLPSLDDLFPLYSIMHAVGRTALRTQATPGAAAAYLQPIVDVLQASAQSSAVQEQSAAVLCAGGLFEALASFAALRHSPILAQLEAILVAACTAGAAVTLHSYSAAAASPQQQLLVLRRDCASLAYTKTFQSTGRPTARDVTIQCQLSTLLHTALSLEGLFEAAAARHSPTQASSWLRTQLAGVSMQYGGSLSSCIAGSYQHIDGVSQCRLQALLLSEARRFYIAFGHYALHTPSDWVQAVENGAVREVLDKVFMTAVLLLSTFWQAASAAQPPSAAAALHQHQPMSGSNLEAKLDADSTLQIDEVAALALDALGYLQFCRMRLAGYSDLLQAVLSAAAQRPPVATRLMRCLPCYADVTPAGPSGQPLWVADTLLASRVQFLMSMLTPCVAQIPQEELMSRAVPLVFLYLQQPTGGACAAAHGLFGAVLQRTSEAQREQLVPFYLRRSLEAYPYNTPFEALAAQLDAAARLLSVGSAVTLLVLRQLAAKCSALLQQEQHAKPALDLSQLLFHLLLVVDYNVLLDALEAAREVVLGCPAGRRPDLCDLLNQAVLASDDYSRKITFARWYQALISECKAGNAAGVVLEWPS